MTAEQTMPPEAVELGVMVGTPPPPDKRVTVANWRQPPYNRWAFQHIREIVPTALVARGDGAVWELPADPRPLDAERIDAGRAGGPTFGALLDRSYTDAVAVVHRGRLVFEQYRNGMAPHTLHLAMSMTKSITSTITGILIGQGRLSASDLITDVLPELRGGSFDGATVRHLLDMRTGTGPLSENQQQHDLEASYWSPLTDVHRTMDITLLHDGLANVRPHGSEFQYRSHLTCLLSRVNERVAGDRFADLVSRMLWQRLGAEHDAAVALDGRGHALADVGMNATLRDLARFGELMRAQGRRGGEQVVPADWVRDVLTPDPDSVEVFRPHGMRYLPQSGAYYRNQWWVVSPRAAGGCYAALGIHGQLVLVHEPAEVVITKLSTWPVGWDDDLAAATITGCIDLAERIAA